MAFEKFKHLNFKFWKLKWYFYDPKRFQVKKIINYKFMALFELYTEAVFTTFVWEKNVMFFFVLHLFIEASQITDRDWKSFHKYGLYF